MTADALAVWKAFVNEHGQQQAELTGPLAAAFAKGRGHAARLALVLHLVRHAADPVERPEVDADTIVAGITLARWFWAEAQRVYGVLGETDEQRDRRELLELIRRKGGRVTVRDLMRGSNKYPTAENAEAVLIGLAKAGAGQWEPIEATGLRGHPARYFRLTDSIDTDTNRRNP